MNPAIRSYPEAAEAAKKHLLPAPLSCLKSRGNLLLLARGIIHIFLTISRADHVIRDPSPIHAAGTHAQETEFNLES